MLKTYTGTIAASTAKKIADIDELVGLTNGVKIKSIRVNTALLGADITINGREGDCIIATNAIAGVLEAEDAYLSNSGYTNELSAYGVSINNKGASAISYYVVLEDA